MGYSSREWWCCGVNKHSWRRAIGYIWIFIVVIVVFGILPWAAWTLWDKGAAVHTEAWLASGIFVALAVPMSIWDVAQHLRHYRNRELQQKVVRIVLMVPIYAVNSWLALRFPFQAIYFDTVRECYEAYVIYNFYMFLLEFLKQRDANFFESIRSRPAPPHLFPLCKMKRWKMGPTFLNLCHTGPALYILFRTLMTIIALVCEWCDVYEEGVFSVNNAYVYITVVITITQTWAMYCLILFYYTFKEDLKATTPLAKLLVIKAIVFFSFWQSILIAILADTTSIFDCKMPDGNNNEEINCIVWNPKRVAAGVQDFAVCIEMLVFAFLHQKYFSYREFLSADEAAVVSRMSFVDSLKALFDVSDVTSDVVGSFRSVADIVQSGSNYDADGKPRSAPWGSVPDAGEDVTTSLLRSESDGEGGIQNYGSTPAKGSGKGETYALAK